MRTINDTKGESKGKAGFASSGINEKRIRIPSIAIAHGRHKPYQDDFFKVEDEREGNNYEQNE